MIDQELRQLCPAIIAMGFTAKNDPEGLFRFDYDDIFIVYRDHVWIISDPENGPVDYVRLQDLIENEGYRIDV